MPPFGITVDAAAAQRIAEGAPVLPLAAAVEAGRPVRILDPSGIAIAAGVADPENDDPAIVASAAVAVRIELGAGRISMAGSEG